MTYADPLPDAPFEPDGASAFQPRPIHGDASFGHLLSQQRQAQAEHLQCDGLDDEVAQLLPLMLSLARISARAQVLAHMQGDAR